VVNSGVRLDHPKRLEVEGYCHRAWGIQLPIKWYVNNLTVFNVQELKLLQGAAIPVQNPVKGGITSPEISGNPSGGGGDVKSAVTEGSAGGKIILHHPVFIVCNLGDGQEI
jgi:hypothetical protein